MAETATITRRRALSMLPAALAAAALPVSAEASRPALDVADTKFVEMLARFHLEQYQRYRSMLDPSIHHWRIVHAEPDDPEQVTRTIVAAFSA